MITKNDIPFYFFTSFVGDRGKTAGALFLEIIQQLSCAYYQLGGKESQTLSLRKFSPGAICARVALMLTVQLKPPSHEEMSLDNSTRMFT